ncbi:MAG: hypothetical protein AVDCRST_MAG55-2829 [uncultured Rubrobacteraceae bacterium]|uniref:CAAX prenyl protease 2/Lysostaphin resistance protein A-like domain-containing protein n=1 Tax=uncultured Rubrobacteraceae bacterium TaxID=349277 RepID=A0A6J4Q5K2_9ACTN|nr:MAG: hypothetical protein AVDCRST_MAG55-2829 [uncultured Rubrobacteraceae bacterium]
MASSALPEDGIIDPIPSFLIYFGVSVVWFSLAEEIGMRGYLQSHLMFLGRVPALLLVGLVFATWHMPLIFPPQQPLTSPRATCCPSSPCSMGPSWPRASSLGT